MRYLKRKQKNLYIFSILLFVFSLFSKAQAVTLPVVLLLLDYYYMRKLSVKLLLEKLPFFILSVVFGVIALSDPSTQSNITSGMMVSYSVTDIPFLISWSFMFYIIKFIFPVFLCSVYVYPPLPLGIEYYISALLFAGALYLLFRYRRNRTVVFSSLLFLSTIALNIQIIPSRLFIVAERYGYFPFMGLFLLAAFATLNLINHRTELRNKYRTAFFAFIIILSAYYAFASHSRIAVWKNDASLMTDIIDKNPPVGYINRAYGIRGLYRANSGDPEAAIADFTEAMKLDPDDSKTYLNRALVYARTNRDKEAVADFTKAIEKAPHLPHAYSYRAIIYYKLKMPDAALNDCNLCLEADSTYYDCYITRGTLLFERQQYEMTLKDLTKAIFYNPTNSVGYKNRGQVYLQTGNYEKGCADLDEAIRLGNQEAPALYNAYCGKKNP